MTYVLVGAGGSPIDDIVRWSVHSLGSTSHEPKRHQLPYQCTDRASTGQASMLDSGSANGRLWSGSVLDTTNVGTVLAAIFFLF